MLLYFVHVNSVVFVSKESKNCDIDLGDLLLKSVLLLLNMLFQLTDFIRLS